MKNKSYLLKGFIIFFSIFFSNFVLSDEFEFNAKIIESFEKGNLIKGYGGVEINDASDLTISGDEFEFNKINSLLKVKNNILINDKLNKNLIKTNQVIYNKKLNIVTSLGKTDIILNSGHIIEGSNITFDRNLNVFFSDDKTLILDPNKNRFSMNTFNFSTN